MLIYLPESDVKFKKMLWLLKTTAIMDVLAVVMLCDIVEFPRCNSHVV